MRTYELMYIVHPDLVGEACDAAVDKFKGVLSELGCELLLAENWGQRKLAYPIKKQSRGTYVLFYFKGTAEVVAEIERRMRIDENIVRFMTIVHDEAFEVPMPAVEEPVAATEPAATAEPVATAEPAAPVAEEKE